MEEAPGAKRARTGTMPPEIRNEIEKALLQLGEVEYDKKSHKRGPGHVRHRCIPPEDLVHEVLLPAEDSAAVEPAGLPYVAGIPTS